MEGEVEEEGFPDVVSKDLSTGRSPVEKERPRREGGVALRAD